MSALGRLITLAGCAGALVASAQTTFIMHMDSVQAGFEGSAVGIEETSTGYLTIGYQRMTSPPYSFHTFLRGLDSSGIVVTSVDHWENDPFVYGGYSLDPICAADDQYVAALSRWEPTSPPYDNTLFFTRFNNAGDTIDVHAIFTPQIQDSTVAEMSQTISLSDGGFAMTGRYYRLNQNLQGWIVRLDSAGDTLWARTIGPSTQYISTYGIAEYKDRGLITIGTTSMGFVQDNYLMTRTDSLGNELWRCQFGDETSPGIPAVRIAPDSTIITWTRYRDDVNAPPMESVLNLRKWDANGNLIWNKLTQARAGDMDARDMEVLPDGSFICGANYYGMAGLWKFDTNGDSLWLRNYYDFPGIGAGYSLVYDVLPTSDGGFAMCGEVDQSINGPHPNLQTWFVIKTDSMGCVVPGCQFTGLSDNVFGLENTLHAYPNPSNGAFTLELDLPENLDLAGDLLLQVFDAQGRQLLARGLGRDRYQRITLDLTKETAGLYSAHLSDGRRILTGVRLVRE